MAYINNMLHAAGMLLNATDTGTNLYIRLGICILGPTAPGFTSILDDSAPRNLRLLPTLSASAGSMPFMYCSNVKECGGLACSVLGFHAGGSQPLVWEPLD